jgi:hypothetical protein
MSRELNSPLPNLGEPRGQPYSGLYGEDHVAAKSLRPAPSRPLEGHKCLYKL